MLFFSPEILASFSAQHIYVISADILALFHPLPAKSTASRVIFHPGCFPADKDASWALKYKNTTFKIQNTDIEYKNTTCKTQNTDAKYKYRCEIQNTTCKIQNTDVRYKLHQLSQWFLTLTASRISALFAENLVACEYFGAGYISWIFRPGAGPAQHPVGGIQVGNFEL